MAGSRRRSPPAFKGTRESSFATARELWSRLLHARALCTVLSSQALEAYSEALRYVYFPAARAADDEVRGVLPGGFTF